MTDRKVYAGLALLKERWPVLGDVLRHILPHVHGLFVGPDDSPAIPTWLVRQPVPVEVVGPQGRGDALKFGGVDRVPPGSIFLTLDDDLLYPPDYVARMVGAVDRHRGRAIVSFLGSRVATPCTSYYADSRVKRWRYIDAVDESHRIHVPGTGGAAFNTGYVRPDASAFAHRNMADVHLAEWALHEKVPIHLVRHPSHWVPHAPINYKKTIWARNHLSDTIQTEIINRNTWPDLP